MQESLLDSEKSEKTDFAVEDSEGEWFQEQIEAAAGGVLQSLIVHDVQDPRVIVGALVAALSKEVSKVGLPEAYRVAFLLGPCLKDMIEGEVLRKVPGNTVH